MRNDDRRPDRASPVHLRPTPKMPLKLEGTARGGIGYADTTVPTMVGGTTAISARTVAADDPSTGGEA
jgi:hypothetical protein